MSGPVDRVWQPAARSPQPAAAVLKRSEPRRPSWSGAEVRLRVFREPGEVRIDRRVLVPEQGSKPLPGGVDSGPPGATVWAAAAGAARAGGAQPASAYGLSLEVCASGASCGASQGQRSRTLPFGSVRAETQCDYSGIWVRDGGRGRRLTVRLCRLQSCRLRGAAAGAWTTVPPSGIQLVWANAQMLEDSSLSPSESWIVRAVRKSLKSDL